MEITNDLAEEAAAELESLLTASRQETLIYDPEKLNAFVEEVRGADP